MSDPQDVDPAVERRHNRCQKMKRAPLVRAAKKPNAEWAKSHAARSVRPLAKRGSGRCEQIMVTALGGRNRCVAATLARGQGQVPGHKKRVDAGPPASQWHRRVDHESRCVRPMDVR
jgi:hypothetical protein